MAKFMAIYIGSVSASEKARAERGSFDEKAAMAAWGKWVADNAASIVDYGTPLGKTKRVSPAGIEDSENAITAYTVVEAESHEAAAKLFENHPHFTMFPGDSVEVMVCLPNPG